MELTEYQKDVYNGKICPYCKSETKIVDQKKVYGINYSDRKIIACKNYPHCDAYVGTHDDGTALGRLAKHKLRIKKKNTHDNFDRLWKLGYIKRKEAYKKLSEYLGLPREYTHIGMFNIETCNKVLDWTREKLDEFKALNE